MLEFMYIHIVHMYSITVEVVAITFILCTYMTMYYIYGTYVMRVSI